MLRAGHCVGRCIIQSRAEIVHNYALMPTEARILINELNTESTSSEHPKHPTYGYDLEVGSFAAWPYEDLACPCLS